MDGISHWFHEHALGGAIGAGAVAGLLVARWTFSLFWDDLDDFFRALWMCFQPDFWSLLKGELFEDWSKTMQMTAYLLLCGGVGFLVYRGVYSGLLGLPSVVRTP